MKHTLSTKQNITTAEAQQLADFVLFSQRNCILKLSPELTQDKISYPQFFLLTYLAEEESLSMSSIARMMGHSTAAATGMVDKLHNNAQVKNVEYTGEGIEIETILDDILYGQLRDYVIREC